MNVRTSGRAAILSLLCLPTILSAADVEELAGLPVIGGIPTSPAEFVLAARDEPSLMRIAPGEDSIYSGFAQIFADDVPIGPAPHTPWARPLAGERLRVLVVSELHANHDVAELVRALDADYRHAFVPFMYHYPTSNPEFYAEDACFPVRARQALSEGPDVIVAPAVSRLLGDQFAQQVLEKVRAGAGLVLIGGGRFGGGGQYRFWTFENDTPEAWRELDLVDAVNGRFQHSPEPSVSPDAGIFTDVPFSMLPGHHLFDLDLAEGAEALACDGNLPLLVTGTVGKGRVVLLPWAHWWGPFPIEEKNRQPELLPYQEYYASAVAKAILYAANRTAAVGVHVATKTIEAGKPGNASVQIDPVPEPAQVCFNTAAPYGEDLVNGARSFYDGPIMSWSGYGRDSSQYERYVWVMALQGHWSLGWWYGSCFYHPWDCWYPQATWVNTMTRPLRDGAGDLLLLNRPILSEPIAFLYSQPSLYAMGVLGQEVNPNNPNLLVRPAQWARISLQRMLQDQGVQFRFVSEEQLQKGQCGGLKLLILSSCVAIEPETAKAVRAFVEQGGIVLADLSPGVFDDHGVPQSPGLLDELFGVEHTARFHLKTDIAEWGIGTHHAPPELPIDGQWFIGQYYEDTLRVADGRAIGKHVFDPDGVPAFVYKKTGKGSALLMNYLETEYRRVPDRWQKVLARELLHSAGIETPLTLYDARTNAPIDDGLKVSRWRDGPAHYIGILLDKGRRARVELRESGHVYELARRLDFGQTGEAEVDMRDRPYALLAVMPYRVEALQVELGAARCGQPLSVSIALPGVKQPVRHVVHLEVRRPDGTVNSPLTQNVTLENGRWQGTLPLALNDPTGTWTMTAAEAVSGVTAAAKVEVKP